MQCWQLFWIQHKCNLNFPWSFVYDFYCLIFNNDLCSLVLINSLNTTYCSERDFISREKCKFWRRPLLWLHVCIANSYKAASTWCQAASTCSQAASSLQSSCIPLWCALVSVGGIQPNQATMLTRENCKGSDMAGFEYFLVGRCILQETYSTFMQLLSWGWGEVINF